MEGWEERAFDDRELEAGQEKREGRAGNTAETGCAAVATDTVSLCFANVVLWAWVATAALREGTVADGRREAGDLVRDNPRSPNACQFHQYWCFAVVTHAPTIPITYF